MTKPSVLSHPRARLYIWGGLCGLIVLLLYALFSPTGKLWWITPAASFSQSLQDPQADYSVGNPQAWIAHPAQTDNPAQDAPPGFRAAPRPPVDVFFIPTSGYTSRHRWNAPLKDRDINQELDHGVRHVASIFNGVGVIYAPRYRQAGLAAFASASAPDARAAQDLAYQDILAAYKIFQEGRGIEGPQRPFVLASQGEGGVYALRLLQEQIANHPVSQSLVVAYVVGWPVVVEKDLRPWGLNPCETPEAIHCVMAWTRRNAARMSFFTQAKPSATAPRLCVNPLDGWHHRDRIGVAAHLGALPISAGPLAMLRPNLVGAQCDAMGMLDIFPKSAGKHYTLPNPDNPLYDYSMFWANIRANVEARVSAFYSPR